MNTAVIVDKIEKSLVIRIQDFEKSLFEYDNTTPESILYFITGLTTEYGVSFTTILDILEQFTPTKIIEMINEAGQVNEYRDS